MENNEYKGYSLFKDIEDSALRIRNRAVIMANIAETHTKQQRVTAKGASLLVGYFKEVPDVEKKSVMERFGEFMKERGYVLQAA
jgi:hypothetical protein